MTQTRQALADHLTRALQQLTLARTDVDDALRRNLAARESNSAEPFADEMIKSLTTRLDKAYDAVKAARVAVTPPDPADSPVDDTVASAHPRRVGD